MQDIYIINSITVNCRCFLQPLFRIEMEKDGCFVVSAELGPKINELLICPCYGPLNQNPKILPKFHCC